MYLKRTCLSSTPSFPLIAGWETDMVVVNLPNQEAKGNTLGNTEKKRLEGTWTSE